MGRTVARLRVATHGGFPFTVSKLGITLIMLIGSRTRISPSHWCVSSSISATGVIYCNDHFISKLTGKSTVILLLFSVIFL